MHDSSIARREDAAADRALAARQAAEERAERLIALADERADRIARTATPDELGELLVDHDLAEHADAVLRVLFAHVSLVVCNESTPMHVRMARDLRDALVACIAKDLITESRQQLESEE